MQIVAHASSDEDGPDRGCSSCATLFPRGDIPVLVGGIECSWCGG